MLSRRRFLTVLTIGAAGATAGCAGDQTAPPEPPSSETPDRTTEAPTTSLGSGADFAVRYHYQRYDAFRPANNTAISYQSDAGEEYAVAQVVITNQTTDSLSLSQTELSVLAGDAGGNVSFYQVGNRDVLDNIQPGETVETWLSVIIPAGAELTFGPTQWANHSFALTEDPSLEIGVVRTDN